MRCGKANEPFSSHLRTPRSEHAVIYAQARNTLDKFNSSINGI